MKLVICEKPSVAQSLAKVLRANKRMDGYMEGNGYIVSWCIGHLVELQGPEGYDARYARWKLEDLPIFPKEWKYQISEATKKQFTILKSLMSLEKVTGLVNACDAGREGELIFRLVYHQARCRKPVERLWISSMEDTAIKEGFANLKSSKEYDALYEAALCRERADWIVGMNATRLFSCLYRQTLNVGRVMTPTLAMVVMRDAKIAAFRPEPFYTVQIAFEGETADSRRFSERKEAEDVLHKCKEQMQAIVESAERREKVEHPPLLYDLTSLQRDANRILGFSAQQTLDYTQSLYEKKMITYPRTDSRYLTEDLNEMIPELIVDVADKYEFRSCLEEFVELWRITDNERVTDHHAIIPTQTMIKGELQELPSGERAILQMISVRLLVAVSQMHVYAEESINLSCAGELFTRKRKTILEPGWKAVEQHFYPGKAKKSDKEEYKQLTDGQTVRLDLAEVKEGKTTAPKHYTEDTLLQSMEAAGADEMPDEAERKGLGTPATRAGILEKLIQKEFLERKGNKKRKYLEATHKGISLITVMPEQIQSASMTADWEQKLMCIERGEYRSEQFMQEIFDMIASLVSTYEIVKDAEVLMPDEKTIIGKCPVCGSAVTEKSKGFFCADRNCGFVLWKNDRYFERIGKKMNREITERLLSEGKVKLKDCKSQKTGRSFDAIVCMSVTEQRKLKFTMEFDNGVRENDE